MAFDYSDFPHKIPWPFEPKDIILAIETGEIKSLYELESDSLDDDDLCCSEHPGGVTNMDGYWECVSSYLDWYEIAFLPEGTKVVEVRLLDFLGHYLEGVFGIKQWNRIAYDEMFDAMARNLRID